MVVVVNVPVVYVLLDDKSREPSVEAEYQSIVLPVEPVAVIVAELPLQIVSLPVDVIVGNGLTVTITTFLVKLTHPVEIFLASA